MTIDKETGEVHQIDGKQYAAEQRRLSQKEIQREWERIDARFAELTNGYDDQAFADLKQIAISRLDEKIQPAYVNLDVRRSKTLKRMAVEHLEGR